MTNESEGGVSPRAWSVAEAKAGLSGLIDAAVRSGPQLISRRGRPTAIVVSADEWVRRTARKGSLADFLAGSPLRGSGLQVDRSPDAPRDSGV